MIRFCDKEICCISYDNLNRSELLGFFLQGNLDDIVCVFDGEHYMGKITYTSLLDNVDIQKAIQMDYLMIGKDMWEMGRKYYDAHQNKFGRMELLPVLNRENQIICFAYQDDEANRELRMLRELEAEDGLLQFEDVFPEYTCVRIYECNELAYYFVRYLKRRGIGIHVQGELWKEFDIDDADENLEYATLNIYAEGVWEKSADINQNLLRSASVEFECIDRIYEENIKCGKITDAAGDFEALISRLKKEEEIVILGTGNNSQNAYDLLLANNIDICCFMSDDEELRGRKILGKPILDSYQIKSRYKNAFFIDCQNKYSAWGFGGTNIYDYNGYYRNEKFVLLQDYIEIPKSGLLHVLEGKNIVLTGDIYLCRKVYRYLERELADSSKVRYGNLWKEETKNNIRLVEENVSDIEEDNYLLIYPVYYTKSYSKRKQLCDIRALYIQRMEEEKVYNYSEYFSDTIALINQEYEFVKYQKERLNIGKIIIGVTNFYCGNILFRDILDTHPDILLLRECFLNSNLYSICICLAQVKAADVVRVLWEICDTESGKLPDNGNMETEFPQREVFNREMEAMLQMDEKFTSQELFVMIHIAYAKMWGKEIKNINDMIIYWEPHLSKNMGSEEYAKWLGDSHVNGYFVDIVRNMCVRAGSALKYWESVSKKIRKVGSLYRIVLECPDISNDNYKFYNKLLIKFEDLKCNPQETLHTLCEEVGMEWSDTLLETTCHGKLHGYLEVTGFDLRPVYNNYEQYFTGLDRLRIMITAAPWQKKYGYPYENILEFSRRELQEMFLKEYRFEQRCESVSHEEKVRCDRNVKKWLSNYLWKIRRMAILEIDT